MIVMIKIKIAGLTHALLKHYMLGSVIFVRKLKIMLSKWVPKALR